MAEQMVGRDGHSGSWWRHLNSWAANLHFVDHNMSSLNLDDASQKELSVEAEADGSAWMRGRAELRKERQVPIL